MVAGSIEIKNGMMGVGKRGQGKVSDDNRHRKTEGGKDGTPYAPSYPDRWKTSEKD